MRPNLSIRGRIGSDLLPKVGFDINTGGLTVDTQTSGAEVILDAVVTNTPIFVRTSNSNPTSLSGSLLIDNVSHIILLFRAFRFRTRVVAGAS